MNLLNDIWAALNKPYPTTLGFGYNLRVALAFGVFTILFNWLTDFSFSGKSAELGIIMGVLVFVVLFFNIYFVPLILPQFFREEDWKVWKEILWVTFQFPCLATVSFIFFSWFGFVPFTTHIFIRFLGISTAVGSAPVIALVLFEQKQYLKKHLKMAEAINSSIKQLPNTDIKSRDNIEFKSSNGGDELVIDPKQLMYIKSADNYAEILWHEGHMDHNHLVRKPLKHLEEELEDYVHIIRCHRKFIVNMGQVEKVLGNAQGYKLILDGSNHVVPVSRSYIGDVQNWINR